MPNDTLEALKECASILEHFVDHSRINAPSLAAIDHALARANAAIRAGSFDPDATIPGNAYEQDICGCHQPIRYCLFPKCGGRQQ